MNLAALKTYNSDRNTKIRSIGLLKTGPVDLGVVVGMQIRVE
jgi:hypothetical protein